MGGSFFVQNKTIDALEATLELKGGTLVEEMEAEKAMLSQRIHTLESELSNRIRELTASETRYRDSLEKIQRAENDKNDLRVC